MLEKIKNKKVLGVIGGISVVFLITVIILISTGSKPKDNPSDESVSVVKDSPTSVLPELDLKRNRPTQPIL